MLLGENVALQFRSLPSGAPPPVSDVHTDVLQRACALLISTPLCYPRFFFQQTQRTALKLSVTPQPRQPGEPVGASASQRLAVKVEGVVASSAKGRAAWRTVEAVEVAVAASFVAPPKSQQMKQVSVYCVSIVDQSPCFIRCNQVSTVTVFKIYIFFGIRMT